MLVFWVVLFFRRSQRDVVNVPCCRRKSLLDQAISQMGHRDAFIRVRKYNLVTGLRRSGGEYHFAVDSGEFELRAAGFASQSNYNA